MAREFQKQTTKPNIKVKELSENKIREWLGDDYRTIFFRRGEPCVRPVRKELSDIPKSGSALSPSGAVVRVRSYLRTNPKPHNNPQNLNGTGDPRRWKLRRPYKKTVSSFHLGSV